MFLGTVLENVKGGRTGEQIAYLIQVRAKYAGRRRKMRDNGTRRNKLLNFDCFDTDLK
jgi:hypothetical protein